MLARFFNDYEEIKDSTNKNRQNIKSESTNSSLLEISGRETEAATLDEDTKVYDSGLGGNGGATAEVEIKVEVMD